MVLLDSAHLISTRSASSKRFTERDIHPAICVATGFGFIVGTALLVHVVFNVLM